MTNQSFENLDKTLHTGLKGVFKTAGFEKSFFSSWVTIAPIFISVIILLISFFFKVDSYNLIIEIKNVLINVLPDILGFTIGGFALMVGFIQSGMLDSITEREENSEFSLYQNMSATFAVNVIFQCIALILAFFIHFVIYIDSKSHVKFDLAPSYVCLINSIALIAITYWFAVAAFMIIQIVLNIFGFSQLHHYFINKYKIELRAKSEAKKAAKDARKATKALKIKNKGK